MKRKLSLAAILSTSAMPMAVCVATIASGIFLGAANSAEACGHRKSDYDRDRSEQVNLLNNPLVALVTLPGMAIATALSVGYRRYNRQE